MAARTCSSTAATAISTKLLGEWVREKQVMTLEQAVRRLTFEFGLDLRPLRPRPVAPGHGGRHHHVRPRHGEVRPEFIVHDFPAGGWRIKEPAEGIYAHHRQRPGADGRRQAHRRICPAACCATPITSRTAAATPEGCLAQRERAASAALLLSGVRDQFGTHVTARISLNSRGNFAQVSPAFSLANSSP